MAATLLEVLLTPDDPATAANGFHWLLQRNPAAAETARDWLHEAADVGDVTALAVLDLLGGWWAE